MSQHSFSHRSEIRAPIEIVFDLVTDHERFHEWTIASRSERATIGQGHPNGVGAVRRIGTFPMFVNEEIFQYDPPTRTAYKIGSLPGVEQYESRQLLTALDESRTYLEWTSTFETRTVFGAAVAHGLSFAVSDLVGRVARTAPTWIPASTR